VNDYGAGARLLAAAKPVPTYSLDARVAITNRNPYKAPTRWDGGDMTNVRGYVEGLTALGVEAEFVPFDELDESQYDLIHLFHSQYEWSRQVASSTTKPLVLTPITQFMPERGVAPRVDEISPVVRRASAVLCYSPLEEDWYVERFPEIPRERFITAPQGVPSALYQDRKPVSPAFSVFMAARYCSTKNQLAVLRACRNLDVPVSFAGSVDPGQGDYIATLRREADTWRGARLFGLLKGGDLWRQYRQAHVHAQPSTWESFGLATWEALACGCNCVVTSNGFGRPVFEPHASLTGTSVEEVQRMIEYELRGPRDRHRFRPPTWEQASRALIPIYREVLDAVPA
jgi:glycosyltransferase involved in cell wall biosynthesis